MPITFVAKGATHQFTNTAAIAPAVPAGIAADDLLICFIALRDSPATMSTVPAGWTIVPNYPFDGGTDTRLFAYYKKALGTEGGTNPAWALAAAQIGVASIAAYRGVHPSSPFDADALDAQTVGQATTATLPAITIATKGAWVIGHTGADEEVTSGTGMVTWPAGWTERADEESASANVWNSYADIERATTGSYSGGTVTYAQLDNWGGAIFALKPAVPLATTFARTVPTSIAIAILETSSVRAVPTSIAVSTTQARAVPAKIAVATTETRAVPSALSIGIDAAVVTDDGDPVVAANGDAVHAFVFAETKKLVVPSAIAISVAVVGAATVAESTSPVRALRVEAPAAASAFLAPLPPLATAALAESPVPMSARSRPLPPLATVALAESPPLATISRDAKRPTRAALAEAPVSVSAQCAPQPRPVTAVIAESPAPAATLVETSTPAQAARTQKRV